MDNINVVVKLDLDADPIIGAVRELMSETEIWKSSPTELLNTLESYVPEKIQKSRAWPKRPHILSLKLKRASSFLKTEGIEIVTGLKESKGERKIEIRKINNNSAPYATNNQKKDKILI